MSRNAEKLRFGPAGVPDSSPQSSTVAALAYIRGLNLDCHEMEFVRGVKIGSETAARIKAKAEELDIGLSAHAPYYINLNSPETGKRLQSQDHLLRSARAAVLCGAKSVVFHAGYYGMSTPEEAYDVIKREVGQVLSILRVERVPIVLRIETMGKASQFGSLDEVLSLSRELEGLAPCLDFSHLHAREGQVNSYPEFRRVWRKVEKRLGRAGIKNAHIHISGIEYGAKGERRHLNLPDSDFRYHEWIRSVGEAGVEGHVVCESPAREVDARMLQDLYRSYRLKH